MRHKERLSRRLTEGMSIVRIFALNEHTVGDFFDKLEGLYQRFPDLKDSDIYNMDESGFQMTAEKQYVCFHFTFPTINSSFCNL